MPWQGSELFDYDLESILIFAPMKSGVFAILAHGKWLYIGESDNICGQLLARLGDDNVCRAQQHPTHFAYELVAAASRSARQSQLVQEFQPVYNAG